MSRRHKSLQLLMGLGVSLFGSSCVYLQDRGRDFLDSATISSEVAYVGVGAQVTAFQIGVGGGEGIGFGLRSGALGAYGFQEVNALFVSSKTMVANEADWLRHKGYQSDS